jgi:hypothetical protein
VTPPLQTRSLASNKVEFSGCFFTGSRLKESILGVVVRFGLVAALVLQLGFCCVLSWGLLFRSFAHFGRPTSRRNSMGKKLIEDQKVNRNSIPLNLSSDFQSLNCKFDDSDSLRDIEL